jgi:hypothetical protein
MPGTRPGMTTVAKIPNVRQFPSESLVVFIQVFPATLNRVKADVRHIASLPLPPDD